MITTGPVVSSTTTVVSNEDVLMVVEIPVVPVLNPIDNSRLQINQKRSWDVVLVIRLVKKHIFSITSLIYHQIKSQISSIRIN